MPGRAIAEPAEGRGHEQLAPLARPWKIVDLGAVLDQGPDAFVDTAAAMKHLDLVITSDTAVAHLAGALGVPVWVALSKVPDCRWLLDRDDSPWYPTMRLFRRSRARRLGRSVRAHGPGAGDAGARASRDSSQDDNPGTSWIYCELGRDFFGRARLRPSRQPAGIQLSAVPSAQQELRPPEILDAFIELVLAATIQSLLPMATNPEALAHLNLGKLLQSQLRFDEAMASYRACPGSGSRVGRSQFPPGRHLAEAEKVGRGGRLLSRGAVPNPTRPRRSTILARSTNRKAGWPRPSSAFSRVCNIGPTMSTCWRTWAKSSRCRDAGPSR